MANVFDYIFNISRNFSAQISGMSAAAGNFSASVEGADSDVRKFTGALATVLNRSRRSPGRAQRRSAPMRQSRLRVVMGTRFPLVREKRLTLKIAVELVGELHAHVAKNIGF